MTQLHQLNDVLAAPVAVVYKHSARCWQSALAKRQIAKFAGRHPELPVYLIDVLRDRKLSSWIAGHLQVPHQSPQVILVRAGSVAWSASHLGIRDASLEQAVAARAS